MKIPPSDVKPDALTGFADSLPFAFLVLDTTHKILALNIKARRLLGVTKKDSNINLDDFIQAEDADVLSSCFSKLKSTNEVQIPLLRLQSKKKKTRLVRIICKRPTKTFSFVYAFILDPQPPKPLNGTLPITDGLLELIIENSHDGMILFNEDFKIEFASKKFLKQYGFKKSEFINQDFRTVLSPDLSSSLADINLLRRSEQQAPESYQIEITGKGGKKALVDINAKFLDCPIIGLMTAIHFLDITKYDKAIKDLEIKESWYRLLVEAMNEGFAICDENDIVTFVNDTYCTMLGYSPNELIGQPWFIHSSNITEEQARQRLIDRMNGKSERYHVSFIKKDGSVIYTIVSAAPYFDVDGEFRGSFAVVTDITDLKEFQETTQFYLDLLTHDVANQLQIILTASGMLGPDIPQSMIPDIQKNIMDAVQLCNRLITKVKRASQIKDVPLEAIDLTQILNEKIAVVKRIFGATIHMKKPRKPIYVKADMLLGELIWNLLENAASHNQKKDKHIWISLKRKSTMIGLSIADNGPGISPSKKKVLFDKGRRFGGVGLTLISQIAKKYGGRIDVDDRIANRPDLGTKFTLWLHEIKQ